MNEWQSIKWNIEFHIHWLHYVLVQLLSKKSMKMYSIVLDALIFIADRCYYMYNAMDACINTKKGRVLK